MKRIPIETHIEVIDVEDLISIHMAQNTMVALCKLENGPPTAMVVTIAKTNTIKLKDSSKEDQMKMGSCCLGNGRSEMIIGVANRSYASVIMERIAMVAVTKDETRSTVSLHLSCSCEVILPSK